MTLTSSWLPIWLLPVLLAVLTALSIWLYRADRRSCGSLAGWTVTSLRILLLAFISFLLLDPALVETVDDERAMAREWVNDYLAVSSNGKEARL